MFCRNIVLYFHLLLLCNVAFGLTQASRWNRINAQVVQNGTHILRQDTSLTFYEPTLASSASSPTRTTYSTVSNGSSRKRDAGWITSAWTYANITYYSATWKVPAAPANDPGSNIIFFFNSLESNDYSDILQPVLQYNNIILGWSLASWYGDPSGAYYHTTPVAVHEGDTIQGVISLADNAWSVLGYVNGNLQTNISVSFAVVASQASAQFALEVYDVAKCEMYPPSNLLTASDIVLKSATGIILPSWSPSVASNACSAGINYEPNGNAVHLLWVSDTSQASTEVAKRDRISEEDQAPTRAAQRANGL